MYVCVRICLYVQESHQNPQSPVEILKKSINNPLGGSTQLYFAKYHRGRLDRLKDSKKVTEKCTVPVTFRQHCTYVCMRVCMCACLRVCAFV